MSAARVARRLVLAVWFGGGLVLAGVAAPAVFRHAPDSRVAGGIVGAMLESWHFIEVIAPAVFVTLSIAERERMRRWAIVVAILALLAGGAQWTVDLRVAAMRAKARVPVRSLAPDDPFRRRFGALHAIAFALMAVQLVAAGALVAADDRRKDS